jgi:hypothetical protein
MQPRPWLARRQDRGNAVAEEVPVQSPDNSRGLPSDSCPRSSGLSSASSKSTIRPESAPGTSCAPIPPEASGQSPNPAAGRGNRRTVQGSRPGRSPRSGIERPGLPPLMAHHRRSTRPNPSPSVRRHPSTARSPPPGTAPSRGDRTHAERLKAAARSPSDNAPTWSFKGSSLSTTSDPSTTQSPTPPAAGRPGPPQEWPAQHPTRLVPGASMSVFPGPMRHPSSGRPSVPRIDAPIRSLSASSCVT